jgi:hypothetical protein
MSSSFEVFWFRDDSVCQSKASAKESHNWFDFRYCIAYAVSVAEPNGAPGKIIYLGACLIAAVRLAREEKWDNTPRVASRIWDAISLAHRIYDRMKEDFPRV